MAYLNQKERTRYEQKRAENTTFLRFTSGVRQLVFYNQWKNIFVVAYALVALLAWGYREKLLFFFDPTFPLYTILQLAVDCLAALLILLGLFWLISAIGTPMKARYIQDSLFLLGLTNELGEPPLFLAKYRSQENPHITIWEFTKNNIPQEKWEKFKMDIGSILGDTVEKISEKGRRMRLYVRSVFETLYWQDSYLSKENFVLTLGESVHGRETVNLTRIPHILLGGSTGSGKTVLLKLLIMQCVKKGASVFIADFKGGVDFPRAWHEKCNIITEKSGLLDCLTKIVDELERRKTLLQSSGCANIDEYNKASGKRLKRIVFACDEVAEILDKAGLSKEEKELVTQIESKLSIIARQGRAFGMHLILATQRPDATVLTGQIRNNIDFRVCGRADKVLSQIILDDTSAAEQIPKDAQGYFITNTGMVFQSYLLDDSTVFSDGRTETGGVPNRKAEKRVTPT